MTVPSALNAPRCNCSSLRRASRRITQLYDLLLAPAGIRATQYSILAELNRRAGQAPTMNELADALAMDRSTLGHNLRPLQRDGLVSIAIGKDDRRSRVLKMTPSGQRLFEKATPRWQVAQIEFERVFGSRDSTQLRTLLQKVVQGDFAIDSNLVAR